MYLFPSPGAQDRISLLLWLWVALGLIYLGVVITPHLAGWQQSVQNKDKRRKWTFVQKVRKHPSWHLQQRSCSMLTESCCRESEVTGTRWPNYKEGKVTKAQKRSSTWSHPHWPNSFFFFFFSWTKYILLFQFAYHNKLHNE